MAKIRKFSISDIEKVRKIRMVSLPDPWPKSRFQKMFEKYPEGFIVAEEKKEVIGYAIGGAKNNFGKIISLVVDSNWRNQGIGTKLINFLINQFKEKGLKEISAHVRTWNNEALSFYGNLGFKIIEKVKNYYRNGDDAYLMKKEMGA